MKLSKFKRHSVVCIFCELLISSSTFQERFEEFPSQANVPEASLWLLLSAKSALLTNNKSADKLRKEFAMSNDFPAGEEAKLRQVRGHSAEKSL